MINTFFSMGALNGVSAMANSAVIGFALGWCLEQAGFGSSRKQTGFFRFGDMATVKILCTAVITILICMGLMTRCGLLNTSNFAHKDTAIWLQLISGVVFAIAFNMSGWTPATSIIGIVSGKIDALVYLLSMTIGFFVFDKTYAYHGFIYENLSISERTYINELFGVGYAQTVLIVVVILLSLVWVSEFISEEFSFSEVAKKGKWLWVMTMMSILAAVAIAFPPERSDTDKIEIIGKGEIKTGLNNNETMEIAKEINEIKEKASGSFNLDEIKNGKLVGEVNGIEMETFVREKVKGVKKIAVIDLRSKDEFEKNRINGSINLPCDAIALSALRYKSFDRIILVGEEKDTLEAYQDLSKNGFNNVFVLDGGINKFNEIVLKPIEERKAEYTEDEKLEIMQWQKYFNSSVNVSSLEKSIDCLLGK